MMGFDFYSRGAAGPRVNCRAQSQRVVLRVSPAFVGGRASVSGKSYSRATSAPLHVIDAAQQRPANKLLSLHQLVSTSANSNGSSTVVRGQACDRFRARAGFFIWVWRGANFCMLPLCFFARALSFHGVP
jgi:hypothetical protein